jgi:hypothetical protein
MDIINYDQRQSSSAAKFKHICFILIKWTKIKY